MSNKLRVRKGLKKLITDSNKTAEVIAWMGNLDGVVDAGTPNSYVTLPNGEVLTVKNSRVPNVKRLPVIIGYVDTNSKIIEVLRPVNAYLDNPYVTPSHATNSHTWPNYDTLWVRPEQFLPGLVVAQNALTLSFVGFVYYLAGWKLIDNQIIDFSAQVPSTGAKFVLAEVDTAGVVSFLAGTSVATRESLVYSDIPVPSVGKKPLFALKVYQGQAKALNTATYTDIIDLRWSGYGSSSSVVVDWGDIANVPAVFPPDTAITDPLYVRKFDFAVPPTVNDDDVAGYLINDLWHDTVARKFYLCHDNSTGVADWYDFSGSSGAWGTITGYIAEQDDVLFQITEDLSDQIDGVTDHFNLTHASFGLMNVFCNIRQLPNSYIVDDGSMGFTLSYVPTVSDKLIVDYYVPFSKLVFDGNYEPVLDEENNYVTDDITYLLVDNNNDFIVDNSGDSLSSE